MNSSSATKGNEILIHINRDKTWKYAKWYKEQKYKTVWVHLGETAQANSQRKKVDQG